ncbi:ABC transporter substrate-binding protein [Marinivivus vitaminiproducens]|uniref:ABC transporter substrate-binding protein n=1 Tax=Marinivivus vitaminiproducens TaxID=3035935 RepID=UPI0027A60020|nr:ABC transporter substrate-binding protein [Geminicoccaceae bacterium SCSIO 64248]
MRAGTIAIVATLVLVAPAGNRTEAATIALACGAVGTEFQFCQDGARAWAAETGNEVRIVSTPNSATERLSFFQLLLAFGSADVDVFQIDLIWSGLLGPHFLDLTEHFDPGEIEAFYPSLVENATADGRLVGIPWFADAGLLYYRTDLLDKYGYQVPKTWAELADMAERIQKEERAAGQDRMQGIVFQASAYEGLTCNALEWIDSNGGGSIVEPDGTISVDNPRVTEVIDEVATWIGGIAPTGVLSYTEEESRGVFQSGNAVFMRNWPYAWALANAEDSPIKGKVGIAALPAWTDGGSPTSVLGGSELSVSRYSMHVPEAVDLVRYLTSRAEQKRRAIEASFNPTIQDLYQDPDILEASPFVSDLRASFDNAAPRPTKATGLAYTQVSSAFFNAVHSVLSGSERAEPAFADLRSRLEWLSRRWQPEG